MSQWFPEFGRKGASSKGCGQSVGGNQLQPPIADDVPASIRELMPIYHAVFRLAQEGSSKQEISARYSLTENSTENILRSLHACLGYTPLARDRPPVSVSDFYGSAFQSLRIGRKTKISFHRTLRIPEDGNDYPLPASLGVLPIHRVEDFADTVPKGWLERGGFFIPLYQREALFLQFQGEYSRPTISKVCVGRINAITGKPYSKNLSAHEQDYVLMPDQKWLDGINSGKDVVKQFVAMPLGLGYTVEAQITDEETYGGFQLEVFEPKDGRFDEPEYSLDRKVDLVTRISISEFEAMVLQTNRFFRTIVNSIRTGSTAAGAAYITGLPEEKVITIYFEFRTRFFDYASSLIHTKFSNDPHFHKIKSRTLEKLRSLGLREQIDPDQEVSDFASDSRNYRRNSPPSPPREPSISLASSPSVCEQTEMGIAAGGRLTQQIVADHYGVESWDIERSRFIDIHIVNSEMYEAITGHAPLPSPVTPEQYQQSGIPWFSHYDETVKSVHSAGALSKIQAVGEIDKKRGLQQNYQDAKQTINPTIIRRIRTPDVQEAATEFRRRAYESAEAGKWKDSIRATNYLIDLGLKVSASDYALRSHCNYQMDLFFEGDVDSGLALAIDPLSKDSLVLRARCRLSLGDLEGAKEAAETLVSFKPPIPVGFEILAERALMCSDFKAAHQNAIDAVIHDPQSIRAGEILRLASEALANE